MLIPRLLRGEWRRGDLQLAVGANFIVLSYGLYGVSIMRDAKGWVWV